MTQTLGQTLLLWYSGFVLIFFLATNSYYLALTVIGFQRLSRVRREAKRADRRRLLRSPLIPPVSILAPVCNEEANVVENVRSLLSLDYPLFEVVLVNDGSEDQTLGRLIETFDLKPSARTYESNLRSKSIRALYESSVFPRLIVVDKVNGGKADALNAGLNLSRYPIFCSIDSDTMLEPDALLRLIRPFVDSPGITIASGGVVRVANGCDVRGGRVHQVRLPRPLLPLIQVVENLRASLAGRMGWSTGNSLLEISGAFGLFDKKVVILAGGYATDSVAEALELAVRMHRHRQEQGMPYCVGLVPDPVCWTKVPESFRALQRQRARRQRGLIDTLLRHGGMIGRPRYGSVGMISLPGILICEMLSPWVELSGYLLPPLLWINGILSLSLGSTFLVLSLVYLALISAQAILVEGLALRRYRRTGDLARLLLAAVLENCGFRQLTLWCRVRTMASYLRGDLSWGTMERRRVASTV